MIKEVVYSVLFNHPDKPTGLSSQDTWSIKYPDRLEFKYIDEYLKELGKRNKAIYAKITTFDVEVDEDDYFDFNEATKKTEYEWYNGKPVTKIREKEFKND